MTEWPRNWFKFSTSIKLKEIFFMAINDNTSNFALGANEEEMGGGNDAQPKELTELPAYQDDAIIAMQLPPHHLCATHSPNLVEAKDALYAEKNDEYYAQASRSVFKKCYSLWKKQGKSTQAAGIVKAFCDIYMLRPV
ncbi:unnamed protein product [Ixodes pacificus]